MIGPFKIVLTSLVVTLYVVAQVFCACVVAMDAVHEMATPHKTTSEMMHHDHGAVSDLSDEKDHPCKHCEQGANKFTLTTSSAVIINPVFEIQRLSLTKIVLFTDTPAFPSHKALERRSWLDPPPRRAQTPISLKTRLLT